MKRFELRYVANDPQVVARKAQLSLFSQSLTKRLGKKNIRDAIQRELRKRDQ